MEINVGRDMEVRYKDKPLKVLSRAVDVKKVREEGSRVAQEGSKSNGTQGN